MKFDKVPFGIKSSPFLLNTITKHHLNKYPVKRAVTELKENLYGDDFLSGSDSEEGEGRLIAQTKKITGDASMKMTKWSSNNQIVADKILKEFDPFVDVTSDNTKVLGLKWNPKEDYFSFNKLPAPFDVAITK